MAEENVVRLNLYAAKQTSATLNTGGHNVHQVVSDVGKHLKSVLWLGDIAQQFHEMWDKEFGPTLTKQRDRMLRYSSRLQKYTTEQEQLMSRKAGQ